MRPHGAPPSSPPGGYGIDLPTGMLPPEEDHGRSTDPVAIASFGMAVSTLLLGLCCFPVTGIVFGLTGVGLGITSLVRVAGRPARYTGRNLAIAGIVISAATPIIDALVYYLLLV